jgi:hypothetical protein
MVATVMGGGGNDRGTAPSSSFFIPPQTLPPPPPAIGAEGIGEGGRATAGEDMDGSHHGGLWRPRHGRRRGGRSGGGGRDTR